MKKPLLFFQLVLLRVFDVQSKVISSRAAFQLEIVHLNDFHARFEESNVQGGTCKENCIGGFSRVYTAITRIKNRNPDAIVLNAGDNFQGTLWYNIYKWEAVQHFMNMIPFDAYTLGNHEFDDKIEGLIPLLDRLKAPTVVANIDDSKEPQIRGKYNKSIVIERFGKKIGIIGVLLTSSANMADTGNLTFLEETNAVNKEAKRMVAEDNVDTIIVLSHCGYDIEKKIAQRAGPKISLIVGSHSHTFLYTDKKNLPGPDEPDGPYPTIITQSGGRKVLVVQASAYARYLGNIKIDFNANGDVVSWDGSPIYLNRSIPQDGRVNKLIAEWKKKVDEQGNEVIGRTRVLLEQRNCRRNECNLGNLITDAMVHAHLDTDEDGAWTSAAIAILNAGGIRSSIEKGVITFNDIIATQPFENTYDVGDLQGVYLKELLEFLGSKVELKPFAGLRVVYNLTNPVGSKVQSVKVRCRKCDVPVYEPLKLEQMYRVVVISYIAESYDVLKRNLKNRKIGPVDADALRKYIKLHSPITKAVDGNRVQFVE